MKKVERLRVKFTNFARSLLIIFSLDDTLEAFGMIYTISVPIKDQKFTITDLVCSSKISAEQMKSLGHNSDRHVIWVPLISVPDFTIGI